MPTPKPTIDELAALLKRSNTPTVLVEGDDDVVIYRWVEDLIGATKANFLPCHGRDVLLSLFKRRHEFAHLPVAFIADRDMWLFTEIPTEYNDIIWTNGYSIENDLYADADLELLLNPAEKFEHQSVLNSLIHWFAFEVNEYRQGRHACVATHICEIVPLRQTQISDIFITKRGYIAPSLEIVSEIATNYKLLLRGKTLFSLLSRYLSRSDRFGNHSINSLYEVAFKLTPCHHNMSRFVTEIERSLTR